MALLRWEPAREFQALHQEMNRLFGLYDPAGNGGSAQRWVPAMDLFEQDEQLVLRADVPGLSEDDLNIELEENVLTISGERSAERDDRKGGFYRLERATGKFSRSLTLPEHVDPENIKAGYQNGVLEVRIPKPEQPKPRRVEISLAGKAPLIEASGEAPAGPESTG